MTLQQLFDVALQHHQAGRLHEAEQLYRQILSQQPNHADALYQLAGIAHQAGQNEIAVELIRRVIALHPDHAESHYNFGIALWEKGQLEEAIVAYRKAIALKGDYAEAHYNLGVALKDKGQLEEAITAYREAISLKPDYAEAHYNLGNALKDMGQLEEAIVAYRQAIDLKPGYVEAHDNLIYALHFHPACDAKAIAEEHRCWNQLHAGPLKKFIRPHDNDRNPNRRLKIGYVSPDFCDHPVGRFILPLLARHNKSHVEIYAYAHVPVPDSITEQIRSQVDCWRTIAGLPDAQVAEQIRQDRIDILVDLTGHMAKNRLLVFARKPAPIQVTYLGYPGSTGLDTMDYRLTDGWSDPPGQTEFHYSEQLVRLPQTNWCFIPPEEDLVLQLPPFLTKGYVTFGSFNNFGKVNASLLQLWGKILRAVPVSRILLKNIDFVSQEYRQQIFRTLHEEGVAAERIEVRGKEPSAIRHLQLYNQMDIALDTYPYHGTTTTCEALWMGVPVISLIGPRHVCRVGLSILSNLGLPELAVKTEEEYVKKAVELAQDLPRLKDLRRNMRQMMRQSPLMDAPRFARNVEEAYRKMWVQWCGK